MEHRAKVGSFGEWSMFCQNSFSSFLWNVPVSLASENLEKFWFSNIFRVGRKGYCEKKRLRSTHLDALRKSFLFLLSWFFGQKCQWRKTFLMKKTSPKFCKFV